jgi:hypothetical protein
MIVRLTDDRVDACVWKWNPALRLTQIANQCVLEGSAPSVEQALCALYETSLVSAWWLEILDSISSWMGRSRFFILEGSRSCPALAVSPQDLLLCAGISKHDIFEVKIEGESLVFICAGVETFVARGPA